MVTRLKIICNNNTHLTVYPYFSSNQITRIINVLNGMIGGNIALGDALKKMYDTFHPHHIQLPNALLCHHTPNSLHTLLATPVNSFILSIILRTLSLSVQHRWHHARVLVLESEPRGRHQPRSFIHRQRE